MSSSNEQERAKRALWMQLYSEKNLRLIRLIQELEFGEIKVVVHNSEPQRIFEAFQSRLLNKDTIGDRQ